MKKITLLMIALLAVMTLHAQPLKMMTDADMEMMLGKPHAPVAGLKMASYPNQTLARALPRARQALTIEEYVGDGAGELPASTSLTTATSWSRMTRSRLVVPWRLRC